ncbi:unnamed protein product [Bursaphelenchus xylophilus]|uniref:(pine wood nematode) hypothetical protein n=1 Tax=Bursaphelenchus xylophilus TaxID=6326 RepID=A0A7I8WJ05_BURXY|nr:unnamed protein product [Bursaphelenchus xylophilus]CAG9108627.1 unnamed protein product [Bursaphelenchus xylophilus]
MSGKDFLPSHPSSSSGMRSRSVSGRQTPISTADSNDNDDDRMSVSSCSNTNTKRVNRLYDFEKECSLEQSPCSLSSESKTDLSLIPVISDQLLKNWSDGEGGGFDKADVGLLGKKALDLLYLKNSAESRAEELSNRILALEATNRRMRESNVKMQARVEQEEEYISNMLLKRIQKLKTDKESIALKYEEEEEHLTNDLTRKLSQLEKQRDELVNKLSREQTSMMDNLVLKVRKLEAEVRANQKTLEQLRREKVDMENSLEHEQEALFNSLSKRVDQLEAEKRHLYTMLNPSLQECSGTGPPTPNESSVSGFVVPVNATEDNTEMLTLRNQLARARNTILTLRQRVNDMEKEKKENQHKLLKLAAFERDLPTYEEFCQFITEVASKSCASNDPEHSRASPSHSESSISVPGSMSDLEKAGRSPISFSSRDVSMDSFADRFDGDSTR